MLKVVVLLNKAQKEVQQAFLQSEEEVLRALNTIYRQAQMDIEEKIFELYGRKDVENLQSIIYQLDYQKAIKKQIDSILDDLNSGQFQTVAEYLTKCYEEGFVGTMYDLQSQGIPLIMPLDQAAVVRAVKLDSKINGRMYSHFGERVDILKQDITREISRGISTGIPWNNIARNITHNMIGNYENKKGSFAYAMRIARTEGHRIQIQSSMDAQQKAKDAGADIVKQWDASLDGRTRPTHKQLDGQIRELDEKFNVGKHEATAPGMFGDPAEDCNCRCALLQRARWALDQSELDTLKERAEYYGLDKTKDFEEFKNKYLKAAEDGDKIKENKPDASSVNLGGLKDYPKTHHNALQKFIADSPDECRKAWNACADDFHVLKRGRGERGAYYSPAKDGVSLSITSAKKGSSYQTPYQVVFHEFGHHMDYIFNRKYGDGKKLSAFTETFKDGIFGKTLKKEAEKHIEDFAIANGFFKKEERGVLMVKADKMIKRGLLDPADKIDWVKRKAEEVVIDRATAEKEFCKHIKGKISLLDRSDISDMFEPIMKTTDYPFSIGHGRSYWKSRDNGKEGFAEMFSAKVNNPGSWETIKKYFPESVEVFEEMLKVVE